MVLLKNPGIPFISILFYLNGVSSTSEPYFARNFFYDFTEQINEVTEDGSEINNVGLASQFIRWRTPSRAVFYSTDTILSEMASLSPVFNILANLGNRTSVLLSYRLIKNGELDGKRFQDVLPSFNDIGNENEDTTLILEQLSGIVLDFRAELPDKYCDLERSHHFEYVKKWNISFVQYAQQLAGHILGNGNSSARVRVGVLYDECQLYCDYLPRQLRHADFLVVGIEFNTISKFPLSTKVLKRHMETISRNNVDLIENVFGNGTQPKLSYLFELKKDETKVDHHNVNKVLGVDDQLYSSLMESHLWLWHLLGRNNKDVIFSTVRGHNNASLERQHDFDRKLYNAEWQIPFLYLHEPDVSQCALQNMLALSSFRGSRKLSELIVNEYTWNAISQLYKSESQWACSKIIPQRPLKIHLIVSDGIGPLWNFTKDSFAKLITDHSLLGKLSLSTLIFSAKDIAYSACGSVDCGLRQNGIVELPRKGILNFVDTLPGNVSTGCLVDFGNLHFFFKDSTQINMTSFMECSPIMSTTTLVVWQIEIDSFDIDPIRFSLSSDFDKFHLKYKLLQLAIARQHFMRSFEGVEVVIYLKPGPNFFTRYGSNEEFYCSNLEDFSMTLLTWATIYNVRIMFRPAFDTKYPTFGFHPIPKTDWRNRMNQPRCHGYFN